MDADTAIRICSQGLPYVLREEQVQALQALCRGQDTFISLPTGYGKSEVFTLFPTVMDKLHPSKAPCLVLLVCPVNALITDQKARLTSRGLSVLQMGSSPNEHFEDICQGRYQFLIGSPEVVVNQAWAPVWKDKRFKSHVCLFAIDEAHCITEWGTDDFRPEFRQLGEVRAPLYDVPVLLATATTTELIKQGCLETMHLTHKRIHVISITPDRPNIFLEVQTASSSKYEKTLLWLVKELRDKGRQTPKTIFFTRYINHVGKIFTYILGVLGAKAFDGPPVLDNRLIDLYHGDVGSPTQQRITEDFGKAGSSLRVLFSTVGFGMGVDIPDIDRIVHWGVSQSVLFYWQEVGRAGRDNRSSKALLYITAKSVVAEETKPDMKAMVDDIKQGRCVRRAVLERFCRSSSATGEEGMPGVADSAGCTCRNCTCCSVCCDACPC